jgi:adenine deaminase
MRTRLALVLVAGLWPAIPVQTIETRAEVVIRAVTIVDVAGGRLVPGQDIVVHGTRIERIGPAGAAAPDTKTLIDGRGKFAIPGLIDDPVRLAAFSPATLQGLLAVGITTVGDAGTAPALLDRWRRDLDSGRLYSPRIAPRCGAAATGAVSAAAPAAPGAVHDALQRSVVTDGRSPAAALRDATLARARALCVDGLGEIAPGARADLVVLTADPLADIRHTRAIDAVVFRGEVFTYAHLQMLRRGTLPAPTPTP